MLERYTLEEKLVGANAVLFLVIAGASFVLMTQNREVPEPPPIEDIRNRLAKIDVAPPSEDQTWPSFGKTPILDTLITVPSPTPAPPPTPKADPSLAEAVKPWKIQGMAKGVVFVTDSRTRKEFQFDIDEPDKGIEVMVGNEKLLVKIKSLDEKVALSATFVFEGAQGVQEVTKPMFE